MIDNPSGGEKRQEKQKGQYGFTLTEIIVVLVILAILAAFTVPAMMGFADKSRAQAIIPTVREIYTAAQASATEWVGMYGDVPTNGDDSINDYNAFRVNVNDSILKKLNGDVTFTLGAQSYNSFTKTNGYPYQQSNILDVSLSNKFFKYPYTYEKYLPQYPGCCTIVIGGYGKSGEEKTNIEKAKVRLVSYVDPTGNYRINLYENDEYTT